MPRRFEVFRLLLLSITLQIGHGLDVFGLSQPIRSMGSARAMHNRLPPAPQSGSDSFELSYRIAFDASSDPSSRRLFDPLPSPASRSTSIMVSGRAACRAVRARVLSAVGLEAVEGGVALLGLGQVLQRDDVGDVVALLRSDAHSPASVLRPFDFWVAESQATHLGPDTRHGPVLESLVRSFLTFLTDTSTEPSSCYESSPEVVRVDLSLDDLRSADAGQR
jgi:hypothetical protein